MEQRQLHPGKTHSLPKRRGMLPLKHWRSVRIREGEHFARLPGSGVRGLRPFSGSGLEQSASSTTYILSRQSVTLVVAALHTSAFNTMRSWALEVPIRSLKEQQTGARRCNGQFRWRRVNQRCIWSATKSCSRDVCGCPKCGKYFDSKVPSGLQ